MKWLRLFESDGGMPEEEVIKLVTYLVEADILNPESLDFTEDEASQDLTLITPFGKVNFVANGDSFDFEYTGEDHWIGTEEYWRKINDVDYYVWTKANYRGRNEDNLTYLESVSVSSVHRGRR